MRLTTKSRIKMRSIQTQTGTNELMMTERGQEGPYKGTRGRETQDMGTGLTVT